MPAKLSLQITLFSGKTGLSNMEEVCFLLIDIRIQIKKSYVNNNCEAVISKITWHNNGNLIICSFYRPSNYIIWYQLSQTQKSLTCSFLDFLMAHKKFCYKSSLKLWLWSSILKWLTDSYQTKHTEYISEWENQ